MTYRILVGSSVVIETDSPSAALDLAEAARAREEARTASAATTFLGPELLRDAARDAVATLGWRRFQEALPEPQCRVLEAIRRSGESGCSMIEIAAALGLDRVQSATGIVGGGLLKNIAKFGFANGEVIEAREVGGERRYFAGPLLRGNTAT